MLDHLLIMGTTPMPVSIGTLLTGRYAIERELGRGGFGVVYLARDLQLHAKPVVVKCLMLAAGQAGDWVARKFDEEINALAAIDHPGVVRISDAGKTENGVPFLVMDYIEGITLRALMRSEELDLRRIAGLVRQIGSALAAAHANGIIHRDLKPENIMIQTLASGEDHVRLIDFGIASFKDATRAATTGETMVAGTAQYMAPEQFVGRPSTASDVWALGVITYELLTRKFPSAGGPDIVPPASIRPELPAPAEEAILQALKIAESDRPPVQEFADRFYRAIAETPAAPSGKPVQERALDVAIAKEIPVHEPAELVALIRRLQSDGLKAILAIDPDFTVSPEDVRSKPLTLEFPLDSKGKPTPLELTLRIDSPDFEPPSQSKVIRVPPYADSEPYTFLLAPSQLGELRINVELYTGDVALFSRILRTHAMQSGRVAAAAQKAIVTIPLTVIVQSATSLESLAASQLKRPEVQAALEAARRLMESGETPDALGALDVPAGQPTQGVADVLSAVTTRYPAAPAPQMPKPAIPAPSVEVPRPAMPKATAAAPEPPPVSAPVFTAKSGGSRWMTPAAAAFLVCVAVGTTTLLFVGQHKEEFAMRRPDLPAVTPAAPTPQVEQPRTSSGTAAPEPAAQGPAPATPVPANPAPSEPVPARSLPPVPTPPASPVVVAPAEPPPVTQKELDDLQERQTLLSARVEKVTAAIRRLGAPDSGTQSNIPPELVQVQSLMDQATRQLRERDAGGAKKTLDSVQPLLEKIESQTAR